MSIHYSVPHKYTKCHLAQILSEILMYNVLPTDIGEVVDYDNRIEKSAKLSYVVSYNSRMTKVFGKVVPTCTKSLVECMVLEGSYYYPIIQVEDYGDEGSFEVVAYIRTHQDIIKSNSGYFDDIQISN